MTARIFLIGMAILGLANISLAQSKSGYQIENAQSKKKRSSGARGGLFSGDFMENVFFQPNFGLAFGSNEFYLNLSPTVGYRITEEWDAGLGVSYIYTSSEAPGTVPYRANTIGGNIFSRYMLKEPFFVMGQYEYLGTKFTVTDSNISLPIDESRQFYQALLAGGGLMQPIGTNGAFVFSVLYNFSYDANRPFDNGPYSSPYVVNAGFMIGF